MDWSSTSVRDLYRLIGQKVKVVRNQRMVTQTALGKTVGLTRSSIANIEAGRQQPAVHVVLLIAHSLGVPVTDLLPDSSVLDKLARVAPPVRDLEGHSTTTHDFVVTAVRRATGG